MENFQTYLPYALVSTFALAGLGKIVGVQKLKQEFMHWNLPNWVRILIGLVEIMTADLLLNFFHIEHSKTTLASISKFLKETVKK